MTQSEIAQGDSDNKDFQAVGRCTVMLVFAPLPSSRRGWPCHDRRVTPALFAPPHHHRHVVKFEAYAWQVTQTYTMRLRAASQQESADRSYRWRAASLDYCRGVRVHSRVPQMLGCRASTVSRLLKEQASIERHLARGR